MKSEELGGVARALKWIGIVLAMPVVLFLLLTLLLYIPFVQDFAVRQVVDYVEEETGYNIELERLRISFPLDLDLQGLVVTDVDGDTIVATQSFVVDLDMARVLSLHVGVDAVDLRTARVNTKDMIASMSVNGSLERFYLNADDVDLERQYVSVGEARLANADIAIAMRDTVIPEEESEPVLWVIDIDKVAVDSVSLHFVSAGDSLILKTSIASLEANNGHIDLGNGIYDIGKASVEADTLHLAMLDVDGATMSVPVPKFSVGWGGMSFCQAPMSVDLDGFALSTEHSHIEGDAFANLAKLKLNVADAVKLNLKAEIAPSDVLAIGGGMLGEWRMDSGEWTVENGQHLYKHSCASVR